MMQNQQANPLLNGNVKQMANMMKYMNNPQAMLTQMAQSNPQAKQVLDLMNSGTSPKDLFYKMAEEKGVDPNEILNMFK